MAKMTLSEETLFKLVFKLDKPEEGGGGCTNVAVVAGIILILIAAYARSTFFDSRPWLFWIIVVAALLIEAFFVYAAVKMSPGKSIQEATVSIDINSQKAVRVEKLKSGKIKQDELELAKVKQVVVRFEKLAGYFLLLEKVGDRGDFSVASGSFGDGPHIKDLGVKIGKFLGRPVVYQYTEGGRLEEEKHIQG